MRSLFILFFLILTCIPAVSPAQKKAAKISVSGYVTDQDRKPIEGAVIFIDKIKTNVITDQNGFYNIRIKAGAREILVFTLFNGAAEEMINGRSTINFALGKSTPAAKINDEPENKESVNAGYGTIKKEDMAEPVRKVDVSKNDVPYQTIYDMIRGRVAGVEVSGNTIRVIGSSSLNVSTEPLYVVDGVIVNNVDDIDPQTVKSIEVLKGPAASVYGTRGSNGVILITRRSGKD